MAQTVGKQQSFREEMEEILEGEIEDAVLCSFGPDYFNGARQGAGLSSMVSLAVARRLYTTLRLNYQDYLRKERFVVEGKRLSIRSVLSHGVRLHSYLFAGFACASMTSVVKAVKFFVASQRVNEFWLDHAAFSDLYEAAKEDNALLPVFEEYVEKLAPRDATVKNRLHAASFSNDDGLDVSREGKPRWKSLQDFVDFHSARQTMSPAAKSAWGGRDAPEPQFPTFWDGFAVGVLGTIRDCHLPSRPPYAYLGMRFGML